MNVKISRGHDEHVGFFGCRRVLKLHISEIENTLEEKFLLFRLLHSVVKSIHFPLNKQPPIIELQLYSKSIINENGKQTIAEFAERMRDNEIQLFLLCLRFTLESAGVDFEPKEGQITACWLNLDPWWDKFWAAFKTDNSYGLAFTL
jgi:hypothetical protein